MCRKRFGWTLVSWGTVSMIVAGVALMHREGRSETAPVPPPQEPVEQLTPVLSSVVFPPAPVRTTDGNYHLVYELSLTNTSTGDATINKVAVRDPSRDLTLKSASGTDVTTNLKALGGINPSAILKTGQSGIFWLDVPFQQFNDIPTKLDHQVDATLQHPDFESASQSTITQGAEVRVATQPALVIGPPVRGEKWIAGNGCCGLSDHRKSVVPIDDKLSLPERFAIDWIKLDSQNRVFSGDRAQVESYPTYGQPVLAVLDATVVTVANDLPDQIPFQSVPESTLQALGGNRVVLDLGGGKFVLYAHLKPGSVLVHPGDHVKRGDVLGLVGNSGDTEAPHLHFQITNGPGDGSQGVPYVIATFFLRGRVDEASADAATSQGSPVQIETSSSGARSDELPMDSDLLDFPIELASNSAPSASPSR